MADITSGQQGGGKGGSCPIRPSVSETTKESKNIGERKCLGTMELDIMAGVYKAADPRVDAV